MGEIIMEDLTAGLGVLSMLIVSFSMGFGVNLKKWYGWVQVFSGFLLGFLMGQELAERWILAIFIGLLTLGFGPIAWKRRQQAAEEVANSLNRLLIGTRPLNSCPRCGSPLPRFQIPTSVPQLMYGGSTCRQCGCEVDNTGHEINPQ
jgi:hypothetical protein